jgi:DivIVA domain-containing protein
MGQVDDFLEQCRQSLVERSRGYGGRVTGNDVRQVQFSPTLRGYSMDEVDDFLDHIAETLDR